ncbi:MAG: hypothetical protein K2M00_01520 [Muribaculaceae bacterium]|nr:hypothetical protein [Muribaculaceae bacterium]
MKTFFRKALSIAAVSAVMVAAVSCGESQADKIKKLDAAAAAVDSVYKGVEAPVSNLKAQANDTDVTVSVAVLDSMIRIDLVGDEMMDYFMAQQIKKAPAALVNEVTKAVTGTAGALQLSVTDLYGNERTFSFTGETLRHLYKAKGSQLNAPRVKEQVCRMLLPALPNALATTDAESIDLSVDKSFLTYTVTFASDRRFKDSGQGLLTRIYMDAFKAQYASLGELCDPVVEMLKSLGIDGVCVIYKALNGDKEIRQAFPWRTIME